MKIVFIYLKNNILGQSANTADRAVFLNRVDPGSLPYDSSSLPGVIPEYRTVKRPGRHQAWTEKTETKTNQTKNNNVFERIW